MRIDISRRNLLKSGLAAGMCMPLMAVIAENAAAADLPALDPADPTAKALGFVTDTSKVDGATNPTHTAAQRCGVCAQFQGKAGDARGGCNIFVGKSVPQTGWCKVWAAKPA